MFAINRIASVPGQIIFNVLIGSLGDWFRLTDKDF